MIQVPENNIVAIGEDSNFNGCHKYIIESLAGNQRRDWMSKHAYHCLPMIIANQYGFAVKSLYKFSATWDGGDGKNNVHVRILDGDGSTPKNKHPCQFVNSHFGMGTITIQNRFTLRTPSGVNLMTMNPPNTFIDGLHHIMGVIETDNLRRDFTFNLKLTRPNHQVIINKGDWIGCVLPIPRYFQDNFVVRDGTEIFDSEQIYNEQLTAQQFGKERREDDPKKRGGNGKRYFKGEDIWGNQFLNHQRTIKKVKDE